MLSLDPTRQPDIIQVISWNDHGESHAIAPVLGAQPGSEAWTNGMGHEAFREMTAYWIRQWKLGKTTTMENGEKQEARIWMWYRTHPKDLIAQNDEVGRPDKADWAEDVINIVVVIPSQSGISPTDVRVNIKNGAGKEIRLEQEGLNMFTVPFIPGPVRLEVSVQGKVVLSEIGREISGTIERYNFNVWSGGWTIPSD